ncbi:MAG: NAD-glutamate dehydrogenase [Acidobacteria bacterium]|nr:NAD-glutamate dehydrogenase [Acidobacteriota bacterium]
MSKEKKTKKLDPSSLNPLVSSSQATTLDDENANEKVNSNASSSASSSASSNGNNSASENNNPSNTNGDFIKIEKTTKTLPDNNLEKRKNPKSSARLTDAAKASKSNHLGEPIKMAKTKKTSALTTQLTEKSEESSSVKATTMLSPTYPNSEEDTVFFGNSPTVLDTQPNKALLEDFSQIFLRRVEERYTKRLSPDQLRRNIAEMLSFISERKAGEIKIRSIFMHKAGLDPNEELVAVETCMEDQPFIVDTIKLAFVEQGLAVAYAVTLLVPAQRDANGVLLSVNPDSSVQVESVTRFLLQRVKTLQIRQFLVNDLHNRLSLARATTSAFLRLKKLGREIINEYHYLGQIYSSQKHLFQQVSDFLSWLLDEHFVFFGASFYQPKLLANNSLGSAYSLVKNGNNSVTVAERFFSPNHFNRERFGEGDLIKFHKSGSDSQIHRAGKILDIMFRRFDDAGNANGGVVFHGLLTQKAISSTAGDIPMFSSRLDTLLNSEEVGPENHRYRAMRKAFDAIPVEFLLETSPAGLKDLVTAAIKAESTGEAVTQVVFNPDEQSVSAFMLITQDVFTDSLRETLQSALSQGTQAQYSDRRVTAGYGRLIGLYFYLAGCQRLDLSVEELESQLLSLCTPWLEQLGHALRVRYDLDTAKHLQHYFGPAFPDSYQRSTTPEHAVRDVALLEMAVNTDEIRFDIFQESEDIAENHARLRLYYKISSKGELFLSDILPILDNFGFRIVDQEGILLDFEDSNRMQMDTFRFVLQSNFEQLFDRKLLLVNALRAVFRGDVKSGRLNYLTPQAGLNWEEVDMLRAYVGYALQICPTLAREAVNRVLRQKLDVVRALVDLFNAKFLPDETRNLNGITTGRTARVDQVRERLNTKLNSIQDATEDRVLRTVANLIESTVRTNFFRTDRKSHYISFKINCANLESVPEPRPKFEIFVHASTVEGVHLRGGKIARGGLRWSDRIDDYRTEVFGLMRTQMVKNVLIVPVGAKGGFILKLEKPGIDRRAFADKMYETFIRGLLDVTDNIIEGRTVTPAQVVCFDEPDPYLVVAADKGTAHLSDTANRIAHEYGFWLGDAFASGGSVGYDHKIYAITARGAWACARHHFSFLGVDPERDVISVVGIGDMSGDVFGNGLLLSRTIRLLGAFDHRHVFLDPNPDPESSFEERSRLFNLPRSSWADYSKKVLSKGGGVFSRTDKEIVLSEECKAMLGVTESALPPETVIRKLLTLNVDMIWNGGIGTYFKASDEEHAAVGDRINDALRVNASEVKAKVIAEGGNLGATQRARIEYARFGGRINTDAIDNSGGVDLSDHEVNLKILLAPLVAQGSLSVNDRNALIKEVAHDMCTKVVDNNNAHALLLSLDQMRSKQDPHAFMRVANFLAEQNAGIPEQEQFPNTSTLLSRGSQNGLYRPELAKLVAYIKMFVSDELLKADPLRFPDNEGLLHSYFPELISKKYHDAIERHLLLKELLATLRTSEIIQYAGATFFPDLMLETNRSVSDVAMAYSLAMHWLGARELRAQVLAQDNVAAEVRYQAIITIEESLRESTSWLLHFLPGELLWKRSLSLSKSRAKKGETAKLSGALSMIDYMTALASLREHLPSHAIKAWKRVENDSAKLQDLGFSQDLAINIAFTHQWPKAFPIAELGERSRRPINEVAQTYLSLGQLTQLNALILRIGRQPASDIWEALALRSLRAALVKILFDFSAKLLSSRSNPEELLSRYPAFLSIAADISRAQPNPDAAVSVSALVVVSEKLRKALDSISFDSPSSFA